MSENPEIIELENERSHLEQKIDSLDSRIGEIRKQCDHERVDHPGITNPWWCVKCGGEMPELKSDA